ncbi:hypothetical protein JKP88DRAFT_198628, partial [Tribonema minus]
MHRGGASVVLRLMSQCGTPPDLAAYNLALRACRGGNAVLHADKILADMAAAGLAADRHTFRSMLHACKQAHNWERALAQADRILATAKAAGLAADRHTYKGVLRACKRARDWERALAVFRDAETNHPAFVDADMWTCLVQALAMCGQPRRVLAAAARMAERGVAPSAVTSMAVLKAHAELGDAAAVDAMLPSVRAAGLDVSAALARVALGYTHSGHVDAAEAALEAALSSRGARHGGAAAAAVH